MRVSAHFETPVKTLNILKYNCIKCVMVNVLASSAVDCGFESPSCQTKDYEIGICCFSTKHAALRRKEQRLVGSESE